MKVVRAEQVITSELLSGQKVLLNYQPVINFREHKVYCLEALLNWQSINVDCIDSETLIAKVEQDPALNVVLDSYVVRQAIDDLCALTRSCEYSGCMSVNISPNSLESRCFIDHLKNLFIYSEELAPFQIDPSRLILEVTERLPWLNPQAILAAIAELTQLGVRIAVDDFITGYANFGTLLNENVTIVKIDRCITERLLHDENVRIFAEQFKGLTDHLNKTVIVEGIEECEQATWLNDHGYNLFQGYFFAVPTDLAGITRYLKAQSTYGY